MRAAARFCVHTGALSAPNLVPGDLLDAAEHDMEELEKEVDTLHGDVKAANDQLIAQIQINAAMLQTIEELKQDIQQLQDTELASQNMQMFQENLELQQTIEELKQDIEQLQDTNAKLQAHIAKQAVI